MSDLTKFRDHCRVMAAAVHSPECKGERPGIFYPITVRPDPECGGCVTDADRALFALLAAEVDDYLAPQPDLFGEMTDEPVANPTHTTEAHDAPEAS